jgi:hypothetical protein
MEESIDFTISVVENGYFVEYTTYKDDTKGRVFYTIEEAVMFLRNLCEAKLKVVEKSGYNVY